MANNSSHHLTCHYIKDVEPGKPLTPAFMFTAGVVGNVVALILLGVWRRRTTLYHILVTALLTTDLLGSVSVSPVVLCAYAWGKTLVGMSDDNKVCLYFGFSMTFLSLSTLGILCAMALERIFSIGHPYFYERHLTKRCGYFTIALIYAASILFCVAPFMNIGKYVQYCPGTWCFLEMENMTAESYIYIQLYASVILIMISSTVVCNISVIAYLVRMYRRHKTFRRRVSPHSRYRRSLSMTEEVECLLPLAIITVVFMCCTFPLVFRMYISITGSQEERDAADLRALRLLSFHSIINPWVFIILRPYTLKTIWRKLGKSRKPPLTVQPQKYEHEETDRNVDELHPTT